MNLSHKRSVAKVSKTEPMVKQISEITIISEEGNHAGKNNWQDLYTRLLGMLLSGTNESTFILESLYIQTIKINIFLYRIVKYKFVEMTTTNKLSRCLIWDT